MKIVLLAITLLLSCVYAPLSACASSLPPPQPPTCAWCDGPPPPPVPVPTVAPIEVSPISIIAVNLSPTHVQRGHATELQIDASPGDEVTGTIVLHDTRWANFKTQIGDSGTLVKSVKIPKDAALGRAQLKVTVNDPDGPYTTAITFEVVK